MSHKRFLELLCPLVVMCCVRVHTHTWMCSLSPAPGSQCTKYQPQPTVRWFVDLHSILHQQLCNFQGSDSKRNELLEILALNETLQAHFMFTRLLKPWQTCYPVVLSALTCTLLTYCALCWRKWCQLAYGDWHCTTLWCISFMGFEKICVCYVNKKTDGS